ncbi:hypothetical protein ABTY15_39715, partial [Kitasatospora sp. NPDC097643]
MLTKRYGLAGLSVLLVGLVLMALWGNMSSNGNTPGGSGTGQLVGAQDAAPAGGGSYGSYGSYDSGGGASASPSAGGQSGGRAGGALTVRNDAKLGTVVTDGQGFTLYRFDKDTAKPPMSNCNDGCAKTWPPVAKEGTTAGSGIDAGA